MKRSTVSWILMAPLLMIMIGVALAALIVSVIENPFDLLVSLAVVAVIVMFAIGFTRETS